MTVIREKQTYSYPKPSSAAASDTESLRLGSISASDSESLNDEPHSANRLRFLRPRSAKACHVEELLNIKKSSGKKKIRRYQNRCILQTLNEEDENENGSLIIIMEPYKSPFTRLLEDKNALEYWNNFIEKSEEEQKEIVKEFSKRYDNQSSQDSTNRTVKQQGRISSRIRRTIKIRKDLSFEVVKGFEDDLISFFKSTPKETYVKFPPTSFDRLLLHAIAQYHGLKSLTVLVEDIGKRSIEIYNTSHDWTPANCFLTDFIKQLRR